MSALSWLMNLGFGASASSAVDVISNIALNGTDARVLGLSGIYGVNVAFAGTQIMDSSLIGKDTRAESLEGSI